MNAGANRADYLAVVLKRQTRVAFPGCDPFRIEIQNLVRRPQVRCCAATWG
jgi:hypothetical protein